MRSKKAQITWFIIIGIVILLGAGTVVYIRQTAEEGGLEAQLGKSKETLYEGELEIRNFVDSCLSTVTLQGLEIQRLQAGYIDTAQASNRLTIREKQENEQIKEIDDSKNVYIDKAGPGNEAPFWVTKNGISIPSKEFMEAELEYYITKELDKCVGDFKDFTDKGFIIKKEAITTDASFAKSVWVSVQLPLTVTIMDITYEIKDFNMEIPIDMELIYNIASDLAFYQESYSYLESFTLDLIEKYSWRGGSKEQPHYFPPKAFTNAGFDCSQTTWTLEGVRDNLKDNYNKNFQYLKIANTNFEREIRNNPAEQGVFDSYIYNFLEKRYPSVHIDYVYDKDWFFNLNILPKSGSILRPDTTTTVGIPMIPRLCTSKYRFNYFYDFPVLMKIRDDKSAKINPIINTFEKEAGYEFHVPLWVFVCGNQRRECTGRINTHIINTSMEEASFCKDSQKISGDIKINIKDGINPLEGVDIYYLGSNSMQNCFIGSTNAEGTFTGNFPFCKGCSIELYKEGYPTKKQRLDILDYENKEVNIDIAPFVDLNVNAKLIHIPTFVRSWHETEKFTDAEKMIGLAQEYGYDSSGSSPNLKELMENKALMGVLKGERDFYTAYNDKLRVSGKGQDDFYYIYPDPENAKLSLGSGTYDISLITTANVEIQETNYGYGAVAPEHKGIFTLSTDLSYEWDTKEVRNKNTVTFYSPVEYESIELNPGNWLIIDDPIMQDETMKAEILYVGEGILSFGELEGCRYWKFNKISGRNKKEAEGGICRRIDEIDIKKEEYLPYIMPELN